MTDAEIIARLGGPTAVAAALGEARSTVSNWIHPQRAIPHRMRPAILHLARLHGLGLDEDSFLYLPPINVINHPAKPEAA